MFLIALFLSSCICHIECNLARNDIISSSTSVKNLEDSIYNFTVPKTDPNNACIRMEASFLFIANYIANNNNGSFLRVVNFTIDDLSNFTYTGLCNSNSDRVTIEIDFYNDWRLEFYFYKHNITFLFNHIVFYYKFTGPLFPNSVHKGAQSEIYDLTFINSTLDRSFVCSAGIRIDLGNIVLLLQHLRIEPYFDKKPNPIFEFEATCPSDNPLLDELSNSHWTVIIVIFTIIVSFVLLTFVFFRLKQSREGKDYGIVASKDQKDSVDTIDHKDLENT